MLLIAALASTLPFHSGAASPNATGTLRKIAETGSIAMAYNKWEAPFVYATNDIEVLGYSHDFSLKIAEAVRHELKLPGLRVKPVLAQLHNRFTAVQDGDVDISCGTATNTLERQKMVAFSNSIFVTRVRILTHKESGIKEFADLAGRNVAVQQDSTSEDALRKLAGGQDQARKVILHPQRRSATVMGLLQSGQVDAYVMDDAVLYGVRSLAWQPGSWVITGKPLSLEAYGCMMRKDDPEFKLVVDREIARVMKSGEAQLIYRKWFQSPIPPDGLNLGMPLSDAMIELFNRPNDKAFE